jgi:hypothetical protein
MRNGIVESATEYGTTAVTAVEKQAARIPSEAYLVGALGSIGISLALKLMGRDRDAEFVGHWVPTFLTLGLFTKLLANDRKPAPRGRSRS